MPVWFLFNSSMQLLIKKAGNEYEIPSSDVSPIKYDKTQHVHSFFMPDGTNAKSFQVKVPYDDAPEGFDFIPLRKSYFELPHDVYRMAGKMEELIYWDNEHKFCGRCGGELQYDTEISKRCPRCGNIIWPSLQIAIIVLIKRDEKILLVQSVNFKTDMMGLVAGFVETGETLEQAVAREVFEETHIKIKNLRYFSSQAWPYPCNLMAGFVADYESGDIVIQASELRKGGWYERNNMPNIPDKASIARKLIDAWLNREI